VQAVDVLIPNYNGREALELCIESIAAYTSEAHRVIVYDDASPNEKDREYLAWARGRGWVDHIIVGREHMGHGGALNALLDACQAPYAAIVDTDVQVLRHGWLSGLLGLAADPQTLVIATEKPNFGYCSRGYRPGMFLLWMGLLNMKAYRDGMAVDWSIPEARRADEPWRTSFASLYPPQDNPIFQHLMDTQWEYRVDFDA
jgi:glycosyltransferase involved in cell wall biosynthesis